VLFRCLRADEKHHPVRLLDELARDLRETEALELRNFRRDVAHDDGERAALT